MKNRINKEQNINTNKVNNTDKRINITLTPTMLLLLSYVLLLLSKFIDVTLLNRDNQYMSVIILQIMIFILPAALWCILNGDKYVKRLDLKMLSPDSILLIISASLMMISGGMLLTMLFSGLGSLSESFTLYNTFISKNDGSVGDTLYLILAFAALPAICEEFLFRGILCYEYQSKGSLFAVTVSSFFFALIHFEALNIPTYLFCGILLCLLLFASRSLLAPIVAHFLYNIFGLFGYPYVGRLYILTGNTRLIVFVAGFVFLFSLALFSGEASRLYRKYLRSGARSKKLKKPFNFKLILINLIRDPYAIACVAVYIIAVFISLIIGG